MFYMWFPTFIFIRDSGSASGMHKKRHRLAASCGFYQLAASCSKSVKVRLIADLLQIIADLLQVVETTCIKLVDKKSWQSTCIKPVDSLQKTCYHQTGASDANASWYRLDDNQATSLQQTCCNLRVSGCVVFSPTGTVDRGKVVGLAVNDPFIVIVLNRSRSVCLHSCGSCIRLAMLKYFRVCGYQVNGDKGGVKLLCSRQPGCNSHVSLVTLVMV